MRYLSCLGSPERIKDTTDRLLEQTKGDPVLFLSLAHGGVAAGMDIFSHYEQETTASSLMYVMRYSVHKRTDVGTAVLSPTEIDYLQSHLRGQGERPRVVIFDEDVDSGATLIKARDYISKEVAPQAEITLLSTGDPYNRLQGNI